jgi:hypothetical protein
VATLHEDARAADCERLLDLLEDDRLREQVALGAVAGAAVEGAEVAVGDADVRVVDVPVDDERDPAGVAVSRTQLVGGLADGDEALSRIVVTLPSPFRRSFGAGTVPGSWLI